MEKKVKRAKKIILIICAYLLVSGLVMILHGGLGFLNLFLNPNALSEYEVILGFTVFIFLFLYSYSYIFGFLVLIFYYDLRKFYIINKNPIVWDSIRRDLILYVLCDCFFLSTTFFIYDTRFIFLFAIISLILVILILFSSSLKKLVNESKKAIN